MSIGLPEIIVILVIVLILFGARRLPDLARSIGKAIGEFKKGMNELRSDEGGNTDPSNLPGANPEGKASNAAASDGKDAT